MITVHYYTIMTCSQDGPVHSQPMVSSHLEGCVEFQEGAKRGPVELMDHPPVSWDSGPVHVLPGPTQQKHTHCWTVCCDDDDDADDDDDDDVRVWVRVSVCVCSQELFGGLGS